MVSDDPSGMLRENRENRVAGVYSPRPIGNRNFSFQNETLGVMADAELRYARLDEQATRYPYSQALKTLLVHLETLATVSVDGIAPDIETTFVLEALRYAKQYGYNSFVSFDRAASEKDRRAAKAALRYCSVIQSIVDGPSDFSFDRSLLLNLHRRLMHEDDERNEYDMHFRMQPYRLRMNLTGAVNNLYLAPEPARIPELIDDLMAFCNKSNLSPTTQAAVAHFHLEAIRPFKTGMDRTGRAFCHLIMRKREIYNQIVPPIAIIPAMSVANHAHLLFPYRENRPFGEMEEALALDRWTMHCAECMVLSVELVRSLMKQIADMEQRWRVQLSGVRKGSVVDMILNELPGKPIIAVTTVMATTGKGFSAANDAVRYLVDAGILAPMNGDRRNRCFVARDALEMTKSLAGKIVPTESVSRESVFF